MTSKERMMASVRGQVPERFPVTIHQWQPYHLQYSMSGIDQFEAFLATGLDASVTPPDIYSEHHSADWQYSVEEQRTSATHVTRRYWAQTPGGCLAWTMASDEYTTFRGEHPIKGHRDAERFAKYWPCVRLDRSRTTAGHERIGDAGILRGFTGFCRQSGPWQDHCGLAGNRATPRTALPACQVSLAGRGSTGSALSATPTAPRCFPPIMS